MTTSLDNAESLIGKLDAFEAALRDLCEAATAHNDAIPERGREEGRAPDRDGALQVDGRWYSPIVAGKLVGATIYRVMNGYPREFLIYRGDLPITHWGDWTDWQRQPDNAVDLREVIRNAA